jgi:hypothetical protein
MNIKNVSKRELLDFSQFVGKVHDDKYKPLSPSNQSQGGYEKSGLSKIKREPAYDHVGYADAVFNNYSKIDVPGLRVSGQGKEYKEDASGFGVSSIIHATESLKINDFSLRKISDF